jgi:Eukaryotic aspartyl protease
MYNPTTSKPIIVIPVDPRNPVEPIKEKTTYGLNELLGFNYKDQVCLNKKVTESCVASQQFFAIVQEKTGIPNFDGIIGINKQSDFFKNLFATGKYENVFSIHIGKDGSKSHLTFGGFDPKYLANSSMVPSYFSNINSSSWSIKTTGLMFGTTVTFNSKYTDAKILLNSNQIVLPLGDFDKIMDTIKVANKDIVMKEYTKGSTFYFEGACPANTSDLVFTFEAVDKPKIPTLYSVPASSWLKKNDKNCDILLTRGNSALQLGRPFLENYYSAFDFQNNRFAITTLKASSP